MKEIVDQGHSVANHTFSHLDLSKCGTKRVFDDIQHCKEVVGDCYILRPPYGGINLASMLLAIALKYKLVFWSIDSLDHQKIPFKQIVNNVLREHPRRGDVVLFHDNNEKIVKALPLLIEMLKSRGLKSFGKF